MVVASVGDDKRISLWRNNGQTIGTILVAGIGSIDVLMFRWWLLNLGFEGRRRRHGVLG